MANILVFMKQLPKSEKEWKTCLTSEQYRILRKKGTELPFTGKYNLNKEKGMYVCSACKTPLFSSDTKYDSGTGWPSFYDAVSKNSILLKDDHNLGMHRIEVQCNKCGSHLGHLFPDGPKPTGLRYCINSISLDFKAK